MNKEMKRVLRHFQCDFNRSIEENFAQLLTESERVRLFFINENQAFTDGRNIVVDPAIGGVFADKAALARTEEYMKIDHKFSTDPWNALRMLTRGQNIHECLHIIYSDFPTGVKTDARASTKARAKTLALTSNIIEDAFIEAVGCSIYDNLELFLQFERIAVLFSNTPVQGTVNRAFKNESADAPKPLPLTEFLNYMGTFLLYPMIVQEEPPADIADYVAQTKQLFADGSICPEPKARYGFTQRIFDIIEPLIPDSEADIDTEQLERMLPGLKTHTVGDKTIGNFESKGKTASISRRLFSDLNGNELPKRNYDEQMSVLVHDYESEKRDALKIVLAQPTVVNWDAMQFDCSPVHRNIKIIETKPKPNLNLRRAYQNIYNKYKININSYNNRFAQLLRARISVREEKRLFGAGISSRRLSDIKKRYWYRDESEYGIPDIAIVLLIDGSGSMQGPRRESAMLSSVILHEVLKKQGITHAIVEHRAGFHKPEVNVNILVDFNARNEEKLNLLALSADGNSRDGLALFWVERFINSYTNCARKLIIVLADGWPAHEYDEYYPPISSKDTANAAAKIIKRGTDMIAVALDDGVAQASPCYDALKSIYPFVVACTDLKRLTGQLLGIISKNL
ncbi:MAG: hypothetical protein LBE35_05865 [Clostridiales bacterium]|jgi:hypothetical protein|nr:hypothetical protein [Clostridiales bacterium]